MNTNTGIVTGTPTTAQAATTYTITATGAIAGSSTATVSIVVGIAGTYYSQNVGGTGTIGSGNGWNLTGGGTLTWAPIIATSAAPFVDAGAQCSALGSGWRLPTQPELSGLFNSSVGPTLTALGWFLGTTWSSSEFGGGIHYAVQLTDGRGDITSKADGFTLMVSCVH